MKIPRNTLAEQALIGALMLNGESISRVADILKPDDFFIDAHREIYSTALELFEQGKEVDPLSIVQKVSGKNGVSAERIVSYIEKLIDSIHTSAGITSVAKQVKELSRRRFLIEACHRIAERCRAEEDPDALKEKLSEILFTLLERRDKKGVLEPDELSEQVSDFVTEAILGKNGAVPTGYEFDQLLTGGFFPGELYIIAGRPGMGKTALAVNIAYRCAQAGYGCLFLSLEMAAVQLGMRFVSVDSGIELTRIRSGRIKAKEQETITQSLNRISKLPIFIDENTNLNPVDVRAKIVKTRSKHPLHLVLIDYLQLIRTAEKNRNRYDRQAEVGEVTEFLKNTAKDLNIPIIALCQLNRKVEDRVDKKPQLGDLRYSGEIEQAADVVMFLYREELYSSSKTDGECEVIVAKNRNGDTGVSKLDFKKEIVTFANRERAEDIPF